MKQKTHFTKLIQIWGIVLIVGIAVCMTAMDIIRSYRDFTHSSQQVRSDYIAEQKRVIKEEVMRVAQAIAYGKSQSEKLTREKIKSRVYEAHSIADNIYQENKALKS